MSTSDPREDIFFLESLLYDNSSPRPPEEFNYENPTESFSPSPIPVEDSDSLMEEIDIFLDGCKFNTHRLLRVIFTTRKNEIIILPPQFEHFMLITPFDFPDCDDSRARGYVLHSLELHILSFILGIQYPNLFD
ncbi:hypothetical protein Tco_1004395 [Tanacetum coccineum]|uniref:Uncharacterized protein n=1 Tax=Tanacetum coccineum TaxID=301880 RepID=A0ABQ5FE49_9ASTR